MARASANPGVEITGSTASPALGAGLGYTTAVDATAAPMRAFVAPAPAEEMPDDPTPTPTPRYVGPLEPRQPGPLPIKMEREIIPPSIIPETKTDRTFTWTPELGEMGALTPGRGFVTTGKDGSPKQINFSTESLAKYLFENQRPTGKVKIVGRDKAGRPITERQMPFATLEDAYKKAEQMSSQNIPGAKEYDIFDFIKMAERPSGVRTYQ